MDTVKLDRRRFLQGVAGAGLALQLSPDFAAGQSQRPPNIVYVHSHDSGRYLGPYGHPLPTPNLNKLASQGVLFRQAFSAAPTCSPSRAALLTGCYPHQNGMLGLAHLGFKLNDYHQHLLYALRPAGYTSVLAGLQHIAATPEIIGYDQVRKPKTTRAVDVAPNAVEFLRSKPKQPFFLDVGFFETHRPFPAPTAEDNPNYTVPPSVIPDTPETRVDAASYRASARQMDWGVGQVLDALEQAGLSANTIVLSTTDHGIAFPGMKCSLSDAGWGVSMILRGPGIATAHVCNAMVSQLDLYPTICELAGVAKPAWVQGKSLLPLLGGQTAELHQVLFAEVNYHAAYEPKRSARTIRWKYNRRYDGRTTAVLPNCDPSPSKDLWLKAGWRSEPMNHEEELYDLVFDPAERNNLAADRAYAQTLAEMRSHLETWMRETDDPLLLGPIPLPVGARTTPVDEIDPKPEARTGT